LAECQPVAGGAGGPSPTPLGMNFAQSGGVLAAVTSGETGGETKGIAVAGLQNCQELLKKIAKGTETYDFVEGMGCEGGCVGGPGTLVNTRVAVRAVRKATEKKGVA